MSAPLPRTLFVGKGVTGITWYRCAVPAMALGQDWVGVAGDPPDVVVETGLTAAPLDFRDLSAYEVVVLQQPATPAWTQLLRRLQAAGTTVLFEIDDYVHSVRKMRTHELQRGFDREHLRGLELNMGLADGIICSTEYLARRYRAFNDHVWVCRNGLDLRRYDLERAPGDGTTTTIGWAGGVGHKAAVSRWLPVVADVLRERAAARFVSIGTAFADQLADVAGEDRCLTVPFAPLEAYPAAMTLFDVALAPSAGNNLFRGKSDLRWLEASALGIPVVGDPQVYPDIEHGVTGFHASMPAEVREHLLTLIDDPALARRVGASARRHVREHRSAQAVSRQWAAVLSEAVRGAGARAA